MTRIVAGQYKGRLLKVPPSGTRPTSERVREALFSRLEHMGYIKGCEVVDLFAGSGAFGLESVSRGASYVELVESAASAVRVIRHNVSELAIGRGAGVAHQKVESWLAAPRNREFDLAFLDPPYDLPEEQLAAILAALPEHMAADGMVVVERSSRSPEPTWPREFVLDDVRSWGDTRAWSAVKATADTRVGL
ncbi:MAG: 16S rRNA (guanine(966)-N(2))-methyltransferase RsmD [Ancrocorticia sp.]|nr:16S rRNA (guanine(966)-N(2))-methyltransferase RsmD [Ancrocorticia sp.]MCI1964190.1 16S rRNA (guanine(966)-N(2))-methyltransferase RsmD [Ancrocorticia sp.]MCI2002627.1 16S rRNA (guanine(966)-N(2))-methyltransferase RsmD [Ancrocorticia sp.]MCI2013322.1 16S rRNA (guanine(966)-N(2))-methyltransferase RsmD [Ancrocorticia sp.]